MCNKTASTATATPPGLEWVKKVDMKAFKEDMDALGRKLRKEEGKKDNAHLHMLVDTVDVLLVVGMAGVVSGCSPFYVFPWLFLGIAITIRWCAIGHHVSHGGYTRCGDRKYQRGTFAVGGWYARARDWLDWMLPEAWDIEHNTLHHYCTNEAGDPDLVERNFETIRDWEQPMWMKLTLAISGVFAWKWVYYAANTWKHLQMETKRRAGKKFTAEELKRAEEPMMVHHIQEQIVRDILEPTKMFATVYFPYIFFRMVLPTVGAYLFAGWIGVFNAVSNIILTELWANVHSWASIVPNHAGDDMYKFATHVKPNSATFYMRQIIGSVDYHTGSDPSYPALVNNLIDGMQGWLNYQIEHHCFPNLSMISYRTAQPLVKVRLSSCLLIFSFTHTHTHTQHRRSPRSTAFRTCSSPSGPGA